MVLSRAEDRQKIHAIMMPKGEKGGSVEGLVDSNSG
jgi:hypothetical protein